MGINLKTLVVALWATTSTLGCSNFIVTNSASKDGSIIYGYAADDAGMYGTLDGYPARRNIPEGTMKVLYDWDSGRYLGRYHF